MPPVTVTELPHSAGNARAPKWVRVVAVVAGLAGCLIVWEASAWFAQRPSMRYPLRPFTPRAAALPRTAAHAGLTEHDVAVNGVRMHYAEGGSGTPIVLCHGWTLNHRIWFRNLDALARVGHVYAIDWPGFGLSAKPADAPYDPAYQAGMLAGFLDALGLDRVHLIGHSMGGHWTTLFLLQHPERVERYVAVSSAAMVPGPAAYRSRIARYVTARYYRRLAAHEDKLAPQMAFWKRNLRNSEPITAAFIAQVSNYDTRGDPGSVPMTLAAIDGMVRMSLRKRVHEIRTPTLVVWGSRDTTVPLSYGKLLARSLPDARLFVLDGVGHMPFLQQPGTFNHAVAEFLFTEPNES